MLDPQQFHCTFCHSLNRRKFFKLEDILGARDLIIRSFAGADACVLIIDVAYAPGRAEEFAQTSTLLGLAL